MTRKYGVKVYNFDNIEYPYFVDGMFEYISGMPQGCTEDEIRDFVEYNQDQEHTVWGNEIAGWYESVKDDPERYNELEEIVDEINFYLETMYDSKDMGEYPEWLRDYLYDIDENYGVCYEVWIPIIDRVLVHI